MNPNETNENLARDYSIGASNFLWAAKKITDNTEDNTEDWLFKLESPVTFLLGHTAELILKAGLARLNLLADNNIKHSHDLVLLMDQCRKGQIPIDPDFAAGITTINNNFQNHDHRYQRFFLGSLLTSMKGW